MTPEDEIVVLYDRHARAVYGRALALTRSPRKARRALVRTFEALSLEPARPFPEAGEAEAPPPSMRALTLSRAREAASPGRRYARWLLSAALLVGAFLLAIWSERKGPRLPDVGRTPPAGRMGEPLKDELRARRHLRWILEGFRREEDIPR